MGRPCSVAICSDRERSAPDAVVAACPPFDLRLTALVLERVAGNRLDVWDQTRGEYRHLTEAGPVAVRACSQGIALWGPAGGCTEVARRLGVHVDVRGFHALAATEPRLAPVVRRLCGLKPQRYTTIWEALCNGVACQQVSLASGLAALGRLCDRCGRQADGLVALPTPLHVLCADLSALGLSRQKQGFLRSLAAAVVEGGLDGLVHLPTATAYEVLTRLPGVGPWTAEYVLLRGLGRLDVFPAADIGAARSLATLYGVPHRLTPAEVRRMVAPWGEWRGVLYFCLLGWRRALGGRWPLGETPPKGGGALR